MYNTLVEKMSIAKGCVARIIAPCWCNSSDDDDEYCDEYRLTRVRQKY